MPEFGLIAIVLRAGPSPIMLGITYLNYCLAEMLDIKTAWQGGRDLAGFPAFAWQPAKLARAPDQA